MPNPLTYFLGWDVGGWNCDKNGESRDAVVILDSGRAIVGNPWRGNLRVSINDASDSQTWIDTLFRLCGVEAPSIYARHILAIDTPLGFSDAFVSLLQRGDYHSKPIGDSASNPYTLRYTERFLVGRGLKPLSAVKDMIGSQATKGIHALAKFAPGMASCGVWTDQKWLTAFETYPSPCKKSALLNSLSFQYADWIRVNHQDKVDALICALVAYCFEARPEALLKPNEFVPANEG